MRNCYWDTESLAYSKEFKPVSVTIIKRNTQQAQRFLIHPTAHYLGSTYTLFCLFLSAFHLLFPLLPSPFIFFFSFFLLKFWTWREDKTRFSYSLSFHFFSFFTLPTYNFHPKGKKKKIFVLIYFQKMCFQQLKRQNCVGFY